MTETDPILELESIADRREQILAALRIERVQITERLESLNVLLGKPKRGRTRKPKPDGPVPKPRRVLKRGLPTQATG